MQCETERLMTLDSISSPKNGNISPFLNDNGALAQQRRSMVALERKAFVRSL
jgi:hypothetical protein